MCVIVLSIFLANKKAYKDAERIGRRTILKRVNRILGLSCEKQDMAPKLEEDEKIGHGYISRR